MKNILFIIALLASQSLFAQPDRLPPKEKVERYKVQFLTEKLDLKTSEAQRFWPVYNEYNAKLEEIQDNRRSAFVRHKLSDSAFANLSDAEIENLVMEELDRLSKIADLKKQYFPQFKAAVGTRKAALYYKAEIAFHQHLMKRLSERRGKR